MRTAGKKGDWFARFRAIQKHGLSEDTPCQPARAWFQFLQVGDRVQVV